MWRAVASTALTLFIVLLFASAGLLLWAKSEYSRPGPLAEAVCLRVPPGSTIRSVSRDLEANGALSFPILFRLGAQYSGRAELLKAGAFLVEPGASMAVITGEITGDGRSTCGAEMVYRIGVADAELELRDFDPQTGRYAEVAAFVPGAQTPPETYAEKLVDPGLRLRVTLAEGVTSWQVVEALKVADFLTGEVGAVPPEGSLAPESYEVIRGDTRAGLLARMARRQEMILADLWAARAPGLPLATPEEALVLASIVEKETGVAEERPQVASVFINRLNRGMLLQTDPTVIYGITGGEGPLGRGLRRSELARPTPYNTYVNAGLPPTPIANPGRAAIAAVLAPAETDFLYFVADGTGGHAFARSLDEHNANVRRWREIEAGKAAN